MQSLDAKTTAGISVLRRGDPSSWLRAFKPVYASYSFKYHECMKIDLGQKKEIFRTSVTKSFVYGVLPMSLILSIPLTFSSWPFAVGVLWSFLISFFAVSAIFLTFLLIAIYFYPVIVHEKGIHGYDYTKKRKILWEEIKKVEGVRPCGAPYIKVTSSEGKDLLYIPNNWLANHAEFKKAIRNVAGPDHPLSQFLNDS